MRSLQRICEYCSHPSGGNESKCGHCGAPLRFVEEMVREIEGRSAAGPDSEPGVGGKLVSGLKKVVTGTEEVAADEGKKAIEKVFPAWQWKASAVGIALVVLVGVLIIRSCSLSAPPMAAFTPTGALPQSLQAAASCEPAPDGHGDVCTIPVGDPLLDGNITGGSGLKFTVRTDSSADTAATIDKWRAAGPAIVSEGTAFVAISRSVSVWYADSQSGLHLETGAFANRAGAQTFLLRSGLVR